jgi:hypothetical protein
MSYPINVHYLSHDNVGQVCDFGHARTIPHAMWTMLAYHLGFGGDIIELTETKIVTRTRVFALTDTVTFSGNKEDMKYLHKAVSLYLNYVRKQPTSEQVLALTKGNPFLVTASVPLIIGGVMDVAGGSSGGGRSISLLKYTAIAALDIPEDEELWDLMGSIKEDRHRDEFSFQDALELCHGETDVDTLKQMIREHVGVAA